MKHKSTSLRLISDSTFQADVLNSALPVLVEFWAEWCGACHINGPMLEELAWRYRGRLEIFRINVDESSKIPRRYGVRVLPTLLLFKGGLVVDYMVDLIPRCNLVQKLEALLQGLEGIE